MKIYKKVLYFMLVVITLLFITQSRENKSKVFLDDATIGFSKYQKHEIIQNANLSKHLENLIKNKQLYSYDECCRIMDYNLDFLSKKIDSGISDIDLFMDQKIYYIYDIDDITEDLDVLKLMLKKLYFGDNIEYVENIKIIKKDDINLVQVELDIVKIKYTKNGIQNQIQILESGEIRDEAIRILKDTPDEVITTVIELKYDLNSNKIIENNTTAVFDYELKVFQYNCDYYGVWYIKNEYTEQEKVYEFWQPNYDKNKIKRL